MTQLWTIGYEGAQQDEVITRLQSAGIDLLIDVRAVPQSRKAGFSKRLLAGSLAAEGIDYLHLRDLGTPKPGREAARRGDIDGLTHIFGAHMQTAPALAALHQVTVLAGTRRACLLCFERDHRLCHRTMVAALVCEVTGQTVVDL